MLTQHLRRTLAVAALVAASCLLAACGDDNGGSAPAATPTAAVPTATAAEPTPTLAPTYTATPVPARTSTPVPTDTAAPVPTATATIPPTATLTPDNFRDLSLAAPAPFTAHGSVEQLYVTDAAAGSELELVGSDGLVVTSGRADAQGSLVFRDVPAGRGYVVATGYPGDPQASNAVDVTTADEAPDESFYAQQEIGKGYGYLETRDGTLLAINVILPGPADQGPYPTVIEYSGYDPANPDSPQPSTLIASALGYAAVGVNMRGTGCSGGSFQFFETVQSTDGYDAVETIAAQPWVKGHKVGMVGISYPGISQLFTAQLEPPHLAAIAPLSVIADTGRGTLYPGGILNNGFATDWAAERQHDAMPGGQEWSQKRMDEGDQVCIANQRLRGQTPDILQMIEDNQFYDPKIADPLSPATFVDKIDVPVFLAGAWQDEQTGPYFATMLDRFTGTDKLHFTMTNGGHTDSLDPTIFSRWVEFLSFYVAGEIPGVTPLENVILSVIGDQVFGVTDLTVDPDRFGDAGSFEEALAQFESDPKVRILFDNGAGGSPGYPIAGFEQSFDAWPIPSLIPTTWYFADGGRLQSDPPDGEGADSFVYDPSRSQVTTFHGSSDDVWKTLPAWDWPLEPEGKVVAYVTDPLPDDVVMAGSGSVDLWIESTGADTDIQVTLSEVRPDGEEEYVQSGWLRASHRKIDESQSTELRPLQTHLRQDAADLPPGEFVEARVELFPFAHAFRAGSRIRLIVGAPGASRALWEFRALDADGDQINTISHAAATPSKVVLPVVPGVDIPTSLPPCPALRAQPCRPYVELTNSPG
jgi:predicted acyl esterase